MALYEKGGIENENNKKKKRAVMPEKKLTS